MPKRFGARCSCCGVPAAQLDLACGVCAAPQSQYDGCEPLLYGEPIAIVVEALLRVVRDEKDAARQLLQAWRGGGPEAVLPQHLQAVSQVTGAALAPEGPLQAANEAVAGWLLQGANAHAPASFALLYERYFVETVFDDPEGLSYTGLLEDVGIRGHNRELAQSPSEAHARRHSQFAQRDLELLDGLEKRQEGGVAPTEEQVSAGILRWMLTNHIRGEPFYHHSYALDQMDGVHQYIQLLMTDLTPVRSLEDGWNYVQRLRSFPGRFALVREELLLQKERGVLPPRFVVEKVLKGVQKLQQESATAPEESAMYSSLLERLTSADGGAGLASVPEELKAAAREALAKDVAGAYESLAEPLQLLLDTVSAEGYEDHAGVQSLPQGAAYYAWRLASETSSTLTPEEVHELGNAQVKAILTEMEQVIARLAPKDPVLDPKLSVSENVQRLRADPRWTYPDTEEGKDTCLKDFRDLVQKITELIDPLFDIRPKQAIKVQPVPKHMEEGSPAAFYMPPSLDGSRDGIFYANLGDMSAQYKFGMRTLTAHEAIPGHHFQLALQFETKGLPYFRKTAEGFTAFVEGWALYTEKLARELGFYATEADGSEGYDLLGHFGDELMRAARLVVDTGLHYYGWSRQKAIEYMEQHTILAPSDVVTEVERYCVLPGQACSYKVGQLRILELRAQLKEQQGAAFDVRAFHRALLCAGAIPVAMLPQVAGAEQG